MTSQSWALLRRVILLAATPTLLGACRSVPDVTRVPVPSGATVFHGSYIGTLTEGLNPVDAVLNADGTRLYVIASASRHTTLLELSASTGQELRRARITMDQAGEVAWREDGRLVIASRQGSGVIDPLTLQLVRWLPAASDVSPDGETLLAPITDDSPQYTLISSRTGAALLTTPSSTASTLLSEASADLTWLASSTGQTLLNLRTAQVTQMTADRLNPCKRDAPLIRLIDIDSTPAGPVLAFDDGTVEWRGPDGTLRTAQHLNFGCGSSSLSEFRIKAVGQTLLYAARLSADSGAVIQVGEVTEREVPTVTLRESSRSFPYTLYFGGLFALRTAAHPLFLGFGRGPTLESWKQWKQSYPPVSYPVSAEVQARYRSAEIYDLSGVLTVPGDTLNLVGTGTNSGSGVPGVIFTQALCSVPPFGPNCPTTTWKADLFRNSAEVGRMTGLYLDPNAVGRARQTQSGSINFSWDGETRFFSFDLTPR